MHKLRVGLVCDDTLDKPDGVQQFVLTLGAWLTAQGHEVHYLTSTTTRTDIPNIHVLGKNMAVRFNGNRLRMPLPARSKRIRRLLDMLALDVIHVQMPYSPLLAHKVIRVAHPHTAVVGTFHIFPDSSLTARATAALGVWLRRSLARFDAITSVSAAAQTFARRTFGVESTVIPNMIDVNRFMQARPSAASAPAQKSFSSDEVVAVGFLGRLVARKGCMELLKAVAYMRDHQLTKTPFRVVIGGKGPLRESLEAYAQQHDIQEITSFIGFVDEDVKASFLASTDVTVFPSLGGESFGISVVEGLAASAGAVLAGDNPGYRSVMIGGEAQLINPADTVAFANVIAHFVDNPAARRRVRRWQRQHVTQFDTQVVARQFMSVYTQALQRRAK